MFGCLPEDEHSPFQEIQADRRISLVALSVRLQSEKKTHRIYQISRQEEDFANVEFIWINIKLMRECFKRNDEALNH